jgi:hypothetical protein
MLTLNPLYSNLHNVQIQLVFLSFSSLYFDERIKEGRKEGRKKLLFENDGRLMRQIV